MAVNSNRIVTWSLATLLIASGVWIYLEHQTSRMYKSDVNREKLRYESLLSEKLSIEKERDKSITAAREATRKNEELSAEISAVRGKLAENASSLERSRKENSASKKKYDELLAERRSLELQLTALQSAQDDLKHKNVDMDAEVHMLRDENNRLKEELRLTQTTRFDKPLVTATRKNTNKLVIKASRTQKLTTLLNVSSEADDLKFTIVNPKGVTLTEKDGAVTSRVVSSTSSGKQVEMVFAPKKKLLPGLYQIEVVSGASHVGSLQVSLR